MNACIKPDGVTECPDRCMKDYKWLCMRDQYELLDDDFFDEENGDYDDDDEELTALLLAAIERR